MEGGTANGSARGRVTHSECKKNGRLVCSCPLRSRSPALHFRINNQPAVSMHLHFSFIPAFLYPPPVLLSLLLLLLLLYIPVVPLSSSPPPLTSARLLLNHAIVHQFSPGPGNCYTFRASECRISTKATEAICRSSGHSLSCSSRIHLYRGWFSYSV